MAMKVMTASARGFDYP